MDDRFRKLNKKKFPVKDFETSEIEEREMRKAKKKKVRIVNRE